MAATSRSSVRTTLGSSTRASTAVNDLTVDPRLDLGGDRVGHTRDPPPLAAPRVQAVAALRGPAPPRQRARGERASGGRWRASLGRPLLGMDRGRRETMSKWAGFGVDAFSPLPLPMIAGEVNSYLFSPKMGMREDLPALLEIALGIADLACFNRTLRLHWRWHKLTDPNKPWFNLQQNLNGTEAALFRACTTVAVGNGHNTSF
jgi:hypothetical protein